MAETTTIAERQSKLQAELDKAAKEARTAARNAKKEFLEERKTAIANAILDGTDAMNFDVDLFCSVMSSDEGDKIKKHFATCYPVGKQKEQKKTELGKTTASNNSDVRKDVEVDSKIVSQVKESTFDKNEINFSTQKYV